MELIEKLKERLQSCNPIMGLIIRPQEAEAILSLYEENQRLREALEEAVMVEESTRKMMEDVGLQTGLGDTNIPRLSWVIKAIEALKGKTHGKDN